MQLIDEAINLMLQRIDSTTRMDSKGFPHYADTNTGKWVTTVSGDWTGGFWVGMLWLAHKYTNEEKYLRLAEQWSRKLIPRSASESVFRCFLFYYGGAVGQILDGSQVGRDVGLQGAKEFYRSFNTVARVFALGKDAEEASDVGNLETNIDTAMVIGLLGWTTKQTNEERYLQLGKEHARRLGEFCINSDGSVIQSASFDAVTGELARRYTHKGYSNSSIWSRAQAWAMVGYAQALIYVPEDEFFKVLATRVADKWISLVPHDLVAFWDFNDPAIPHTNRDTSATAIAASSLLKLSKLLPSSFSERQRRKYHEVATETVEQLVNCYLTGMKDDDTHAPGMLTDGCYNRRVGLATKNELIWGDYYLLESLMTLAGRLDPASL